MMILLTAACTHLLTPPPAATAEDYRLMQQLNQMTIAKYSDMIAMATRLNDSTKQLNEKCKRTQIILCRGVGAGGMCVGG